MARCRSIYLAFHVLCVSCVADTAGRAADFYAIAERDGLVAICLSKGALLFADRCQGNGRISIVQPIKEGPIVWRSATGTVPREDNSPTSCELSHAKWDPKAEQVISTGRKITKASQADILKRLEKQLPKEAKLIESDITAFALDLDNDGEDEIVFIASNLKRIVAQDTGTNDISQPFVVYAGVLTKGSDIPTTLYSERGVYTGGTDVIGDVTIKGVVPIPPGTGEIALLIKAGSAFDETKALIRYRHGLLQRIETIDNLCG